MYTVFSSECTTLSYLFTPDQSCADLDLGTFNTCKGKGRECDDRMQMVRWREGMGVWGGMMRQDDEMG